jgi:putative PEP-CTERM system TPR-repeat lipoprotein
MVPAPYPPPVVDPAVRWRKRLLHGGVATLVVVAALIVLFPRGKPVAQILEEAADAQSRGDVVRATILYKQALQREPDNADAHFRVAKGMVAVGDLLSAEKEFRRAAELGRPAQDTVPPLVETLIDLEKYREALEEIRPDLKVDAETSARLTLLRGRAYAGLVNLVEARTQFLLVAQRFPAESRLGLARIAMLEGKLDEAAKLSSESIAVDPRNVDAWIARGELFRVQGATADALDAFRRAEEVKPGHALAIVSQGIVLATLGEFAKAKMRVQDARNVAPYMPLVHFADALIAFRERRHEDAREALERLLYVIPNHPAGVLLAGSVNYATGQYELAQNAFVAYLSRYPGSLHARKMLGASLLAKGQAEAALSVFTPVLGASSLPDPEIWGVIGEVYFRLGDMAKARQYLERGVGLDPRNPDLLTSLGVSLLASGQVPDAIRRFEAAAALSPANARAENYLVSALISRGELDRAMRVAEALEARLPKSPEAPYLKGSVLRARKDGAGARRSLERALKLQPTYFPAAAAMADLDRSEGKPGQAVRRFEEVLKADPRNLDAMLALARGLVAAGRAEEGIVWLRRALNDHPQSFKAHAVLADAHLALGKLQDALTAASAARELNPRDPGALETLARIQLANGDRQAATVSYMSLVNLAPNAVPSYLQLADVHASLGSYRDAVATLRTALKIQPRSVPVRAALARVLGQWGRHKEALEVAREMQRDTPKAPEAFEAEGNALAGLGDMKRAIAAYESADAIRPSGALRVRIHHARSRLAGGEADLGPIVQWLERNPGDLEASLYLADALTRARRYRDAERYYQAVLKASPDEPHTLNNFAWSLLGAGDPRAVDFAQQAFQKRPSDAIAVDTLGWVLLSQGKTAEGLQLLLKAVSLAPDNPEIRFHLVQGLIRAGDMARARIELKTVLASKKTFDQRAEAAALMAQLGP